MAVVPFVSPEQIEGFEAFAYDYIEDNYPPGTGERAVAFTRLNLMTMVREVFRGIRPE